ncbi:MAG: GerW family sporulation protein [Bacillota bacterium]|nr:GerW family sporulation protein [Bacillota bacterium]
MENHPIENLMKSTLENIKDMIDVNTIVGDPVVASDGTLVIPISKVSFGFASGGSEFPDNKNAEIDPKYPFGGGSGAGVSVKPVAFLVVKGETIRLLPVDAENTVDKLVDSVPQIIDLIKGICKKANCNKDGNTTNTADTTAQSCNINNTTYDTNTTNPTC